ncbi:gamma-glutamyl-gamma-aminobutyrate hydrolase family protein [Rhodobacteraceae bacterium]|nr:gamma-glutamyl-gamma-aminobutyrate hydrolase family protein [Paracoccaceae bacterium]
MARPVVGIIGNAHVINEDYHVHASGVMNAAAIAHVAGALPLIVPTDLDLVDLETLRAACDGFLFTGGRANVHPEEYGEVATEAHGTFDRERDRLTLPLIRTCVDAGQPILAVCRGFQELNVAMGGSLYPEIRDLPGRMNHRMPPDGTLEEKFELRHDVALTEGGIFHQVFGATTVQTNSLHGQGIKKTGERIFVDGRAPDGTEEAIYVDGAPGFALGVQWHPEYNAGEDPVSRPLFEAFGHALERWASGERGDRLKSA